MEHEGESTAWTDALSAINVVFTAIYVVEMACKLIAIGPRNYFTCVI